MKKFLPVFFALFPLMWIASCDDDNGDNTGNPTPPPTVSFSFSPANPEVGQTVTFSSAATNADAFSWSSAPAGFSSNAENPEHAFTSPGTYEITLEVSGPGGSAAVSQSLTVVAATSPAAGFTFSPEAPIQNQEIQLTNTSTNFTSLSWSSETGNFTSTEENPIISFAEAGDYAITLIASGEGGTDEVTQTISVISTTLTASFTYNPDSPEVGSPVTFTNTSEDAVGFEWSSDPAGFSSSEENPTHTFSEAGDVSVTLTTTDAFGNTASSSQTITVMATDAPPMADFTFSPDTPTVGEEVVFTNASTSAETYNWSSEPAGFSSTEVNPTYIFTSAGTYQVTLVASKEGVSDEVTKNITVAAPTVTAMFSFSPANPEEGETITFTNESTDAVSYEWSSDPAGFASTDENPTTVFSSADDYIISLVATDAFGNTSSASQTITVSAAASAPIASFTFSPTAPQEGEEVTFSNTSTNADSYNWSIAETGFSTTDENISVTFSEAGDYTVTLLASGPGGSDETTQTVTVSEASSGNACQGENPCNLPPCYVIQTVTSTSGTSVVSDFEYTTVAGVKVVDKLTLTTSAAGTNTTVVNEYAYDNQARNIEIVSTASVAGTTSTTRTTTDWDGCQRLRDESFDQSGNLSGSITYTYNAEGLLIRTDSFDANGNLTGYTTFEDYDANGNYGNQNAFDANNNLQTTTALTYQNCQPATLLSTDASGNTLLDQTNTFNSQGFINQSVSTIFTQSATVTSTTDYTYECD